jgi:N-methylhydantoinase A
LAEALAIPYVIVPALPGALSAYGILVSDVVKDYSRTVLWRSLNKLSFARLDHEFTRLRNEAENDFRTEKWHGSLACRLSVDMRYHGQGFELSIPYGRDLENAFRREHERRYGYSYPKREIELVTLRLRARMESPHAKLTRTRAGATVPSRRAAAVTQAAESASIFFHGRRLHVAIYARESLQSGKKLAGPAIVTEYSATTFVLPGRRFWLDHHGNMLIDTKAAKTLQTA